MAEETITILKVGTEEAVKSIADLKENVKILKKTLEETQIDTKEGWQQYQDTLEELKVNQNALKDAMYATSGSMEDLAKAATGTSESYNSLVHRMASLKEEFRATNDEARRAELGKQIKEINDQLKDMDAMQGNFQRNVGNYAAGVKDGLENLGKSMGKLGGQVNIVKNGFDAFSKSPGVATIGILVTIVVNLANRLKENETAMKAVKKATDALQPVMDFLGGILEKIAEFLSDVIDKVVKFVSSNGLISKIIKGVTGVGNVILNSLLAPIKAVIEAFKGLGNIMKDVFTGEWGKIKDDVTEAWDGIKKSFQDGFSFKENFKAGQDWADGFLDGAGSKKDKAKGTGKEIGKGLGDGLKEELDKELAELDKQFNEELASMEKAEEEARKRAESIEQEKLAAIDKSAKHRLDVNAIMEDDERKRADESYKIQEEANQKKLSLLQQFMKDALNRDDLDAYLAYDQQRADLEVEIETNAMREKERLRKQDLKDAESKAKAQKDLLKGIASSTSSILGSIADMYENDEENSEKNAKKIKGLRIAAATIDTISGAIGAFMQASQTIPPPYGQIVGAAAAAAVTAAGIANIAKMKSAKTTGGSADPSVSVPSVTSAPSIPTDISNVRSITSATEEDRLNQMAMPQKVYILSSDIEASQKQIKTQVSESSF